MVQEKNIVRLGLSIIMFIAFVGLVSTPALAGGKGKHWHPKQSWEPAACSKTASAAFFACQHEVKDDYWIAKGNCYNSAENPRQCFQDAEDAYEEAKAECQDQLEARQELCEELGEAPYDPIKDLKPKFVKSDEITGNQYFPLVPGYKWTYETTDDGDVTETIVVEVLEDETVTIEGVECVVVRDIVYEGKSTDAEDIIEDTYDWYAQDEKGNVWYFGERTLAREDCEEPDCEDVYLLVNDGSWIAGVENAKPGIIMFAHPEEEVGSVYRHEFFLGDAEDIGEVVSIDENDGVLQTKDYTPIEPDVYENKYYAPGVGVIKEEAFEDGIATGEEVELVDFTITTP